MPQALQLVIAAGLFSLGGVVVGALLSPLTQLFLEMKREQRAAERAKRLVAGELLHAELVLRTASEGTHWRPVEDMDGFLPTSAWHENRSSLAGMVDDDLWDQLVMAYALLEMDRARFVMANHLPAETPLQGKDAEGMKQTSNKLGNLRRRLYAGGGWMDDTTACRSTQ